MSNPKVAIVTHLYWIGSVGELSQVLLFSYPILGNFSHISHGFFLCFPGASTNIYSRLQFNEFLHRHGIFGVPYFQTHMLLVTKMRFGYLDSPAKGGFSL